MHFWNAPSELRRPHSVFWTMLCYEIEHFFRGLIIRRIFHKCQSFSKHISFQLVMCMMTLSNGNIFHLTGPLCGEFTAHQWIPLTKASDAELWWFLWSAPEHQWFETPPCSLWRQCNGLQWFSIVKCHDICRCSNDLVMIQCIWVRSRNCCCLVTWFCYQLIAKPGNKTATVPWPDPYSAGTSMG